jgi:Flp pilus assembly protein TadD
MLYKTIEKNKNDIEAHKLLIRILLKEEKLQDALKLALSALEYLKNNGDIFYLLAKIYEKMGEKDAYKENLHQALDN